MDSRPNLLDADDDITHVDAIPAPLWHLPPPPPPPRPRSQAPIPPPLPIALTRAHARGEEIFVAPITESDEAWLATLPSEAREVLELARRSATGWPVAPRIPSAVATPVRSTLV